MYVHIYLHIYVFYSSGGGYFGWVRGDGCSSRMLRSGSIEVVGDSLVRMEAVFIWTSRP